MNGGCGVSDDSSA